MTRIILVDNESTFRKGLKDVLNNIGDVEIVGEASDGAEFLHMLDRISADVVFIDIRMPVMDGVEATREAKKRFPFLRIYGFSSYESQSYIDLMMGAGANGYLTKSGNNYETLIQIINNQPADQKAAN